MLPEYISYFTLASTIKMFYKFANRIHRVQIDNVLSDFANIICGVRKGSVLGPVTAFTVRFNLSSL